MKLEQYKRLGKIKSELSLLKNRCGMLEYSCKALDNQEELKLCYDVRNDVWLTVDANGEIQDVMVSCFGGDYYDNKDLESFIKNRANYISGKQKTMDISLSEALVSSEAIDCVRSLAELI